MTGPGPLVAEEADVTVKVCTSRRLSRYCAQLIVSSVNDQIF